MRLNKCQEIARNFEHEKFTLVKIFKRENEIEPKYLNITNITFIPPYRLLLTNKP